MTEARAPRRLALEDGKLMPQGDNLHLELKTRPNGRAEGGEQGDEQRGHADRGRYQSPIHVGNGDRRFVSLGRGTSTPSLWVGLQPRRDGVPNFDGAFDRAVRVVGIQLGEVARIAHVDTVVGQLHRRGEGGGKRSIDWGDKVEQTSEVVSLGELDLMGDQIRFQELLGRLLRVKSDRAVIRKVLSQEVPSNAEILIGTREALGDDFSANLVRRLPTRPGPVNRPDRRWFPPRPWSRRTARWS